VSTPAEQAAALRALHAPGEPLVLPNCWDAASARRFVAAGAPVAATSSLAVAEALGSADGQALSAAEMLAAVARIAAAVDVPVTADLEAGYGLEAPALVAGLLEAGAVGLNLEDSDLDAADGSLRPLDWQVERIAALRAAARAAGVDVVLNARVDVHLDGGLDRLDEGLARAAAYRAAGADCVYPIMVVDEPTIAAYVQAAGVVNVIAAPSAPGLARLASLGVARVSFGSRLWRASLAAAEAGWRDFVAQA
jgi:2-methylisocitrate lyase-like PEP mutase family enzyme